MSKTVSTLSEDETVTLLNYLISKNRRTQIIEVRTRNYAMAIFMLEAGLRVGELVKLQLSDVWIGGEPVRSLVIRSAISKNKVRREVPCTARLHDTIRIMFTQIFGPRNLQPDSYIFFAYQESSPLTTRQVYNIISHAGWVTLSRSIHPHVLRHTFATRLMRVTNIRVVQALLGHECIGSTQIYTHPNNQDLSEAISKI